MPLKNYLTSRVKISAYLFIICAFSLCTSAKDFGKCSLSTDPNFGGVLVNCRNRNLTGIPQHLPGNITSLDLSHNKISTITIYALNVTGLRYLDVSFNNISSLSSGAFLGVSSLQELYLNGNKLKLNLNSYPINIFQPLKSLLTLNIENNDLSDTGTYPEDTIGELVSLEKLKIDTFKETQFGEGFSQLRNLKQLNLGFQGCKMSSISNDTFKVFEHINVTTLDLQFCPLLKIESNAFWHFHALEDLILSNAIPLSPVEAMSAMYGLRDKRMKSIKINHIFQLFAMRIGLLEERILSNRVLLYLGDVCVERFEMINVKLAWFGEKIISDDSKFASCIKIIDLSLNTFSGDPRILFELSLLPLLESINVSKSYGALETRDAMKDICDMSTLHAGVTLPSTLKSLNIRGIGDNFGCIYNVVFYNAYNLTYADFSYLGMEGFWSNVIGLEGLNYLDLSGNNFAGMNTSVFASLPKLETLIMSNVHIAKEAILSKTSHILVPLRHLTAIDLSSNNLKILNPDIFSSNSMRQIDLSNNRFQSIPFDLISTPLLQNLNLGFNSLTVLSNTEMKLLDILAEKNNLSLYLEGNLLSCGCQNLDFVRWLYTTEVQLFFGLDNACLADNGSVVNMSYMYEHTDDVWRHCYGGLWLSISISTFAFISLTMTAMYVIHRRKTWLLNITLRLFGLKSVSQILTREDFLHDSYVGYSDTDYQYICHTVRDHLENRHSLKLFIRDRDTTPGKLISHEIIRGIDSSWRCILFVTRAFLEDNWCDFTVEYLVYVKTRRPLLVIILILCDDVLRGDISPSLLNVVAERRIFRFESFTGEDGRLWREVSQCIKIKSNI